MTTPPISRTTDPATSHLAAEAITVSGRRGSHVDMVVAAVRAHPGMVAREAAVASGLEYIECVRRLSDGMRRGLLRQGPARKSAGRLCVTWWPE